MQKSIIKPLLIALALLFLTTCTKKDEEKQEQIVASTEKVDNKEELTPTIDSVPIAQSIECVGKVHLPPQAMFSIHAKVEGYVKDVKLIEGQFVKRGAVLAIIESPSFAVIQKEFLKAAAGYEYAKGNYDRKKELFGNKSLSQKEEQKAEMELKTAKADYLGLKAELNLMGFNTQEIEKGNIQKSLAVFSPVSGYITKVDINNGKKISPDDLLFEIVDRSNVHIQMQVNSKDVRNLTEGDKFTVMIPGEQRKFTGELHYINKKIETETNTVIIHGHLDKTVDANELLVGSMVFIKFKK